MKILQIKFQNINSLKGEHCINFEEEPLKSNSIFAIIGPTGSGKSTLLDVISLALFNEVPRLDKVSKGELSKTGAIITRHQKNAYAEVLYQCQAGTFLSHWDIQYNRNQKLNDYSMSIKNMLTNEELDLKRSEVPAQNEAFIGLNYQQFIKSIVLAQGEFSRFLKAADSDRKQLLEQITGTDIYRKIGMLAFQKANEIKHELDKDLQRISDLKDELLTEEQVTIANDSLNIATKEKQTLEKEKLTLNQQKQWLVDVGNFSDQYLQVRQKHQEAITKLERFSAENQQKIKLHEKTQIFAEDLIVWKQQLEKSATLKARHQQFTDEIEKISLHKSELFQNAKKLLKKEVSWEEVLFELEQFRKKVNQIETNLYTTRNAFNFDLSQLKKSVQACGLQLINSSDPKNIEQFISEFQSKWHADKEKLAHKLAEFTFIDTSDVGNFTTAKSKLNALLVEATEAKNLEEQLSILNEKKTNLTSLINQLTLKIEALLPNLEKQNQSIKDNKFILENTKLKFQNYQLTAELAIHRKHLEEGKPCPLCGATSHPLAAEEVNDELIAGFENKISDLNKQLDKSITENRLLEKEIDQLQTNLVNNKQLKIEVIEEIEKLQDKSGNINELLRIIKGNESWEACFEKLHQTSNTIEQLEKLMQFQLDEWWFLVEKLKENFTIGSKLRQEKDTLFSGNNIDQIVNELKSSIDRCLEKEKHLFEQKGLSLKEIENHTKIFVDFENELLVKVNEQGFTSIEEAKNNRLKENDFQFLKQKEQLLQGETKSLQLKVENIQQLINEIKDKLTFTSENEVVEKITKNLFQLSEVEKIISDNSRLIFNYNDRLEKVKVLENKVQQTRFKNEKWLLLNEVIGDKTGKRFNDFAQDLSLKYLLGMANKRLLQLSNRYQIDRPNENESKDLMIIDHDMGSERRSVKTLSGGETFVVSLALALALSDLASKNVHINSLFIDEGFGTLDPDTLDQTLDTLERLQAETNKTIGIISHVDALKERIQTQIQLQKNGQGYSTLKVVMAI